MKNKYSNVIVVSNIKFSTKPMFKVSNICDLFGYLPTQISPVAVYMIQGPTTDQLKSSHYFQQSPRIKKLGIYCASSFSTATTPDKYGPHNYGS